MTAWPPAVWGLALLVGALAITVGHAVLFGLPAALYCRRRGWTRVPGAITGGFLVGAAPIGVLLVGSTVLDGTLTASNLMKCAEVAGTGGALGVPGGLAFWLTLRAFGEFR